MLAGWLAAAAVLGAENGVFSAPPARHCAVGNTTSGVMWRGGDLHQIAKTVTNVAACGAACCSWGGCTAYVPGREPPHPACSPPALPDSPSR